ncbi:MAG: hypothetical protein WKF57_12015 [Nakamurella sp.]
MHHRAEWLAPGHLLVHRADAGWRLMTPEGAVMEVDDAVIGGEADLRRLAVEPGPVADVFAAAGFGGPGGPAGHSPASDSNTRTPGSELVGSADFSELVIAGRDEGELAAAIEQAVRANGGRVVRWTAPHLAPGALEPGRRPMVLLCNDHPSDASWIAYEEALPHATVPLRVSVEGARVFYEPPPAGMVPLTHRMVRARRLATAAWPDDLMALWTQDVVCGPSLLTADTAALVAGWVLADVETMRGSGPDPRRSRTLRVLDLLTSEFTDHTIFPVPEGTSWRGL